MRKIWQNKYTGEEQEWEPDIPQNWDIFYEMTEEDLQAHNEKIARAAFEAGNRNVSHRVIEGGLIDGAQVTSWKQSVDDYIQSLKEEGNE